MENSGQVRFILQINIEQWGQIFKENVVPRRVGGIIKLISCYRLSLWSKFATMKSLPSCRLKHRPFVSTLSKEKRSKRYLYKLYTVANLHYPLCRCNQAVSWFALFFVACTKIYLYKYICCLRTKVYCVCSIHVSFKCFDPRPYLVCHVTTIENV